MSRFPLAEKIDLGRGCVVSADFVLEHLGPLLTEDRKAKIERVTAARNFDTAVVMEGIYDRGNLSAVMRSGEAFGFSNFHVIETQQKFKEAKRVTQGADKWIETTKWESTQDAIRAIKGMGYKLVVTTLEASKPIDEIDFTVPTALVLGNEKDGVSQEMIKASDERIIIPMHGFVQSFNISVAGALSLYHIYQDRTHKLGKNSSVSEAEQKILKAYYYLRTQDSGADYLRELWLRNTDH